MRLSKIIFLSLIVLFAAKSVYAAECPKYKACNNMIGDLVLVGHNRDIEHGMEYCDDWTIMKLNLTTGIFSQALGVFNSYCSIYGAIIKADWEHNIMFVNSKLVNNDVYVVSLKTGKVMGVLKNVISVGFYINKIIVSPDGAVIYVQTDNDDTGGYDTKIYNGTTYSMITTTTQYQLQSAFMESIGVFTKDSKYLYAVAPDYKGIVEVDAHTGNVLKTINTIPFEGIAASFDLYYLTVSDDPAVIDNGYAVVRLNNQLPYYVYNISNEGVSMSISVNLPLPRQFKFSSDNKNLLVAFYNNTNIYTGEVDVYSIATGKLVDKLVTGTTSQIFPSSSIISWANDYIFIYNTGQKLIYFNIIQNKIVKELPIIKPWETPCWKPVDIVHASCSDWKKQAEKLK